MSIKPEPFKVYRITGNSDYFRQKYGTPNPDFELEATDLEIWGEAWEVMAARNFSAALFMRRMTLEADTLPINEPVYYGKIQGHGELVRLSELEEIEK